MHGLFTVLLGVQQMRVPQANYPQSCAGWALFQHICNTIQGVTISTATVALGTLSSYEITTLLPSFPLPPPLISFPTPLPPSHTGLYVMPPTSSIVNWEALHVHALSRDDVKEAMCSYR